MRLPICGAGGGASDGPGAGGGASSGAEGGVGDGPEEGLKWELADGAGGGADCVWKIGGG